MLTHTFIFFAFLLVKRMSLTFYEKKSQLILQNDRYLQFKNNEIAFIVLIAIKNKIT